MIDFDTRNCGSCDFQIPSQEKLNEIEESLEKKLDSYIRIYSAAIDVLLFGIGGIILGSLIAPWMGFSIRREGWPGVIAFTACSFFGFLLIGSSLI